jgi:hypothetical protein
MLLQDTRYRIREIVQKNTDYIAQLQPQRGGAGLAQHGSAGLAILFNSAVL